MQPNLLTVLNNCTYRVFLKNMQWCHCREWGGHWEVRKQITLQGRCEGVWFPRQTFKLCAFPCRAKYAIIQKKKSKSMYWFYWIWNIRYDVWQLFTRTVSFSPAEFVLFHISYTKFAISIFHPRQVPSMPSACTSRAWTQTRVSDQTGNLLQLV